MTIEQKIPQAVPVAQGQVTDGVTAINNRDNRVESAAFGYVPFSIDATPATMTSAEFWEGSFFQLAAGSPGPGGPVTLNVPAEERGPFVVYNNSGQTVTVQISGQAATPPTIANGDVATFVSDGINVRTAAGASGSAGSSPYHDTIAASDETTDITTGVAKVTFYMPAAVTLSEVFIGLSDPSSSGVVRADLNKAGVSIFSTRPSIDATENTSLTGTAAVLSTTSFAKGDRMTIDIDDAGTDAKGLKLTMIGVHQ